MGKKKIQSGKTTQLSKKKKKISAGLIKVGGSPDETGDGSATDVKPKEGA